MRGGSSMPCREKPRSAGMPQVPLTPMLLDDCGVRRRYRCEPVKCHVSPRPERTSSGDATSRKTHRHRHCLATVQLLGHVLLEMRALTLKRVPGG